MALHFNAFGSDLVLDINGVHTEGVGLGGASDEDAMYAHLETRKQPNRHRFKKHMVDTTTDSIASGIGIAAVGLVLLWLIGWRVNVDGSRAWQWLCLLAGLALGAFDIAWLVWSGGPMEGDEVDEFGRPVPAWGAGKYLARDADGTVYAADDRAALMIGYGKLEDDFIKMENRLRELIVGGKTLPPEACDENVSWKCVEIDDQHVRFVVTIRNVNGMVAWFHSAAPELRNAFGDPSRGGELVKMNNDGEYSLTFYSMPGDTRAGVSW